MKPVIVWIEDDLRYARLLQLELGHRFDFQVHLALDAEVRQKLSATSERPVAAVLIDMHLAGGRQGPEDFRALRALGFAGPIFVLSNDESVLSKLEMLELGVDDYLWKVMPTQELEYRLKNVIDRYRQGTVAPLGVDGLEISFERLDAKLNGKPLDLSKIELKIFLTLFRFHPRPTPVSVFKEEVWGQTAVEAGTISTFIWKLNKKTQGWSRRIVRAGDFISLVSSDS